MTIQDLTNKIDSAALESRSLTEWRPILAEECQVYVFSETYLAKRFDQINYKFCEKDEAKEILIDNLYALLRFKYFPLQTEEIDKRINNIVASFTANLKTTLKKVSFDPAADCVIMNPLPDYCVAFRNGVFDFKKNDWFFKYNVIQIDKLSNKLYIYPTDYAIMWYLDYEFEPLPVNIQETSLEEFVEIFKEITKDPQTRNYCFELLYNISHDRMHKYSYNRFLHICEILGYTILQSFSQYFVMLIGSGQNGKNSLFDGCFTNRVIPRPASNDLDSLENDRFITGSLENKAHNIFLETSAKTYTESKMLKALTGSMYQTIESKGISKYSSIINCKYVFAGNDQDNIKFSDNTTGFKRRIQMLEISYRWDPEKRFLKVGDYYDSTFSDTLNELKNDVSNTSAYVYFGMYGIMKCTNNFTSNFKFTENDWNGNYMDIDVDFKERINNLHLYDIITYASKSQKTKNECKIGFFDMNRERLYLSSTMLPYGKNTFSDMLNMFNEESLYTAYFAENDIYMSIKLLQSLVGDYGSFAVFTKELKRTYSIVEYARIHNNNPYVKCHFRNGKLVILN